MKELAQKAATIHAPQEPCLGLTSLRSAFHFIMSAQKAGPH